MAQKAKRAQGRVEGIVLRRFRETLAGRRISQVELSERVGLSRVQLNKILNGHKPASFTEAVDIAEALDLDLAEVVAQAQKELATTGTRRSPEAVPGGIPVEAQVAAMMLEADLEAERQKADHPNG